MTSAIAKQETAAISWSRDQVDLIKRTVCPKDATDDELKLFLHIASRSGLDPLQKHIYCMKLKGRLVIVAAIDGLQARAARAPDFEGILHGVVCAKDDFRFDAAAGKVLVHTYNAFADRGPILGAWATVQRKGLLPFTAMVKFAEFNAPYKDTWQQMPTVMIDKVARSTALRAAYPEEFGGVYDPAELDQADNATPPLSAQMLPIEGKRAAEPQRVARDSVIPHTSRAGRASRIVDVKPGETEAQAEARAKAEVAKPKEPTPFDVIRELGAKNGRSGKELSSFVRGCTGKGRNDTLTEEDVMRVADAFKALKTTKPPAPAAESAPPEPPPDDVPPPGVDDASAPWNQS